MIANAHPPRIHDLSRECRRHDGLPKRAFPTRSHAKWYARKCLANTAKVYQCPACDYWHCSTKVPA